MVERHQPLHDGLAHDVGRAAADGVPAAGDLIAEKALAAKGRVFARR